MARDNLRAELIFAFCAAVGLCFLAAVNAAAAEGTAAGEFVSCWPEDTVRVWAGPEYWTNPLQDWRVNNGRLECVVSGGDRNVFLLTRRLSEAEGRLVMSVRLGQLEPQAELTDGWVGFKLGVQGEFDDYRNDAVRGKGYRAGMYAGGRLFVGKFDESVKKIEGPFEDVTLKLTAEPAGADYVVVLQAFDASGEKLSEARGKVDRQWLVGGVCLVCSSGKVEDMADTRDGVIEYGNWGFKPGTGRGGNVRFWFCDWKVSGSKVRACPEHAFGPILFSQYTLSDGVLKMTAQMPPIGAKDSRQVELEVRGADGNWKPAGKAAIDELSRTATFRVEGWDGGRDVPYRLAYEFSPDGGPAKKYYRTGTVRKQPLEKSEFVVAGFTGNNDLGFPNNDIVSAVAYHNPDLLFFSGDQIYEGVAGYGAQREPVQAAALDYLRKWYLYGWAYGDLMRDRPTVAIPDDHDVYHGNLWGAGGKATDPGLTGSAAQDTGGYKMPPAWVNMVQRTQSSHLPDAFDPTPVKQGIGVYYCEMNYGGISFAVIEDRKWKSAPKMVVPEAEVHNGSPHNADFDHKSDADVEGAKLLGDRQLEFLRHWANNWAEDVWMKVALSQTIFANVATLPTGEMSGLAVPELRIMHPGEYPPDDAPVSDYDTNGWPQTGRNRALKELRRCFAMHIAGDQHLGSTVEYGIEQYGDAGYAFCVPAISNVWPRRWCPSQPGRNRRLGRRRYTGDYEDGFGNKITVYAVSNPIYTGREPSRLYDRATGYGIVRFNRETRDVTIECWPRLSDPRRPGAEQYPGWPITYNQYDNYSREPAAYLPLIKVDGMDSPIVQVVDESQDEVVYTVRITGGLFRPGVYNEQADYTVKVGEPAAGKVQVLKGLQVVKEGDGNVIEVKF